MSSLPISDGDILYITPFFIIIINFGIYTVFYVGSILDLYPVDLVDKYNIDKKIFISDLGF